MQIDRDSAKLLRGQLDSSAGQAPAMRVIAGIASVLDAGADYGLIAWTDDAGGRERWDVLALQGSALIRVEAECSNPDWMNRFEPANGDYIRGWRQRVSEIARVECLSLDNLQTWGEATEWSNAEWRIVFRDGSTIAPPPPNHHGRIERVEQFMNRLKEAIG